MVGLELPVGLTRLNITARWRRAGETGMHTNRVAPSCSVAPSIPGQILFWMAAVFDCIAGGQVVRKYVRPALVFFSFSVCCLFTAVYVISLLERHETSKNELNPMSVSDYLDLHVDGLLRQPAPTHRQYLCISTFLFCIVHCTQ